jgi:8-oxo-dGTP pyrophosphatase MutT (NUDIX family)
MNDKPRRKFSFDNKHGSNKMKSQVQIQYTGPVPCTNCGIVGHSNRHCTAPVTSYGIIAFRVKNPAWSLKKMLCGSSGSGPVITGYEGCGGFEFLLIRRRDSLRFVEFIRGKYNVNDMDYLRQMVENMTQDERAKLLKHTFDELWNMVWGNTTHQGKAYKNDYESSKEKFQILTEGDPSQLATIISETHSPWTEPEWGFPKGRRNPREDDKSAAMREFMEETGIHPYEYDIIENLEPISESFYGDNHVYYCHKYFMAYCNHSVEAKMKYDDQQMTREIGEIAWCSLDDALSKIRSENVEKREILLRASGFLRNYCPMPSKIY